MAGSNGNLTNVAGKFKNGTMAIMFPSHSASSQDHAVHGGKKKQWSKFDLVRGQVVYEVKEQSLNSWPSCNCTPSIPQAPPSRFKIWGHAAMHARFIEIEWGPKVRNGYDLGGIVCAGADYRSRVSPASRQPPAVFHASREAREEAKKN
ncbi:hypothetical protein N431DRAFT_460115 [Stipitochalara longipes BDJ]|nr:hypothetical protein N431DRAFT_460115 [Stipitochalara longipes BDJ]